MPIYEFYCVDCHCVFSFFSRGVNTSKRPACPRCGRPELPRRVSSFAISKGLKETAGKPGTPEDFDEARFDKAMESLTGEVESLDEDNPRQSAQLMRKLLDATGMPMGAAMDEALRRMESGEDPEKIEEEVGHLLEEDPLAQGEPAGKRNPTLAGLRRRLKPPGVDPNLYEL